MAKKVETFSRIREQLMARREEILHSLNGDLGSDTRSQATGDTGDAASDSMHTDLRSQLAENESRELAHIVEALHKIEEGKYGICDDCGCQIPVGRLEAVPFASLCIECQRAEEEEGNYYKR